MNFFLKNNVLGLGSLKTTIIKNTVEFVEDDNASQESAEEAADDEEVYHCPECGAVITLDMTHCPKCGVEFEFKEDEE